MKVLLVFNILLMIAMSAFAQETAPCVLTSVSPQALELGRSLNVSCFENRFNSYERGNSRHNENRRMIIERNVCSCLRASPVALPAFNVGAQSPNVGLAQVQARAESIGGTAYYDRLDQIYGFNQAFNTERSGMLFQASLLDPQQSPAELMQAFNLNQVDGPISQGITAANAEIQRRYPPGAPPNEDRLPSLTQDLNFCVLSSTYGRCNQPSPARLESCMTPRAFAAMAQIPQDNEFYTAIDNAQSFNPDEWNFETLQTQLEGLYNNVDLDINLNREDGPQARGAGYDLVNQLWAKIKFLNANPLYKNLFSTPRGTLTTQKNKLFFDIKRAYSGVSCTRDREDLRPTCATAFASSDRFDVLTSETRNIFSDRDVMRQVVAVGQRRIEGMVANAVNEVGLRAPKAKLFNTSEPLIHTVPEIDEATGQTIIGTGGVVAPMLSMCYPAQIGTNADILISCVERYGTFCRNLEENAGVFTGDFMRQKIITSSYPSNFNIERGERNQDESGVGSFCRRTRSSGPPPTGQQMNFDDYLAQNCSGPAASTPICLPAGRPELLGRFLQAFPGTTQDNGTYNEDGEAGFARAFLSNQKNRDIIKELPNDAIDAGTRPQTMADLERSFNAAAEYGQRRRNGVQSDGRSDNSTLATTETRIGPKTPTLAPREDLAGLRDNTLITPTLSDQIPTAIPFIASSGATNLGIPEIRDLAVRKEAEVERDQTRLANLERERRAPQTPPTDLQRLQEEAAALTRTIEENRSEASDYRRRITELEQAPRTQDLTRGRDIAGGASASQSLGSGSQSFSFNAPVNIPPTGGSGAGSVFGGVSLEDVGGLRSRGDGSLSGRELMDIRYNESSRSGSIIVSADRPDSEAGTDRAVAGAAARATPVNISDLTPEEYNGFASGDAAVIARLQNRITPGSTGQIFWVNVRSTDPTQPVVRRVFIRGRNGELMLHSIPQARLATLSGLFRQ